MGPGWEAPPRTSSHSSFRLPPYAFSTAASSTPRVARVVRICSKRLAENSGFQQISSSR